MEITEVRIKLMEEPGERLQAFCSITFDDSFVVRDLKIIEGSTGPFVAMPSRKLTAHCPQCGCKNHLRAAYCNQCGAKLREPVMAKDDEGPRQALCRHCPPHQFRLPGNDSEPGDPGLQRIEPGGFARLRSGELRRIRRRPGRGRGTGGPVCERGSDADSACREASRSAPRPDPRPAGKRSPQPPPRERGGGNL